MHVGALRAGLLVEVKNDRHDRSLKGGDSDKTLRSGGQQVVFKALQSIKGDTSQDDRQRSPLLNGVGSSCWIWIPQSLAPSMRAGRWG